MTGTFFPVKGALDPQQRFIADMKVYFCGFGVTMSEQRLDVLTFYSLFHQMSGKAVTQAVRCSFYRNLGVRYSPAHHLFQGTHGQIAAGKLIRRSEGHTSELQSRFDLVCRLLLEK